MNEEDYTPLFRAIEDGDLAEVESLLETPDVDVDTILVDVRGEHGLVDTYTPLNWAIHCNHKSIVELLLDHGAPVNGVDGASKTPLQVACQPFNADEEIVKVLLEHGADVDGMADFFERETPLTLACNSNRKLGIVQLLLEHGADVNGGDGETAPLHQAAFFRNIEAFELLIEVGADVNIQSTELPIREGDINVGTPLHFAAHSSSIQCIATLLAAGVDPNIVNQGGQTPLYRAKFSVDVVNALMAAGCDPLHRDNRGRTPLQCLYELRNMNISAEQFKIVTTLVAAGDRSWECVPTPCPGLEAAMVPVWQAAPDELPELFKRLDEEMKKVVQEVLRVLHRHFAGFPHLKEHLLKSIFDLKFEEAAAGDDEEEEEEEVDDDDDDDDDGDFTSNDE